MKSSVTLEVLVAGEAAFTDKTLKGLEGRTTLDGTSAGGGSHYVWMI